MTTNFKYRFLILILLFGCSNNTSQTVENKSEQKAKMSSTALKIIPTNSSYIPDKIQQDKAKTFLTNIYKNEQLKFVTTDTIEYVHGANFDSVSCNLCKQNIEIEYWQSTMDKAYEKQFTDLEFTTPCCHKKTSLNDLIYHSSAGFAKFVMTITGAQNELSEKDFKELQGILGTMLRNIWARY